MLTAITATLILHPFALAAQTPTASPSRPSSIPSATWADVEDYFDQHATHRNAQAEALMEEEASEGAATWIRFTGMSGGGQWRPIPDGSGIGWPSLGLVVRFGSAAHMNTAADLIEEVAGFARKTSLAELFIRATLGKRSASLSEVQP